LWGGASEKSKIAWVKWEDVCRTKECGGLGVKNLRLVNVSLLMKWRWRLLTSHDSLWSLVLKAKYGVGIGFSPDLLPCGNVGLASIWWKDLCNLSILNGGNGGNENDWCSEIVIKKVGNGGGRLDFG
jgi:hypothetical protein